MRMGEERLCYVVVMLTGDLSAGITHRPLRSDFKVWATLADATARQLELGSLNSLPSWIMSFPDPRGVAND